MCNCNGNSNCNSNSNCCGGLRNLLCGMDECTWIIILIVLYFLFCGCGNNSGCGGGNNSGCGCDSGCGC